MSIEYFHPKTTPDVEVALAVKCSAAIPGRNVGKYIFGYRQYMWSFFHMAKWSFKT
jgi:hypothetical protein